MSLSSGRSGNVGNIFAGGGIGGGIISLTGFQAYDNWARLLIDRLTDADTRTPPTYRATGVCVSVCLCVCQCVCLCLSSLIGKSSQNESRWTRR